MGGRAAEKFSWRFRDSALQGPGNCWDALFTTKIIENLSVSRKISDSSGLRSFMTFPSPYFRRSWKMEDSSDYMYPFYSLRHLPRGAFPSPALCYDAGQQMPFIDKNSGTGWFQKTGFWAFLFSGLQRPEYRPSTVCLYYFPEIRKKLHPENTGRSLRLSPSPIPAKRAERKTFSALVEETLFGEGLRL